MTHIGQKKKPQNTLEIFLFNRIQQVKHLAGVMGREPIVVSPYDAELYGHWWYEGPQFLDFFMSQNMV